MTRTEYERAIRQQLADMCRAAIKGIDGVTLKESNTVVIAELASALAKMCSCMDEDAQQKLCHCIFEQMQVAGLKVAVLQAMVESGMELPKEES